MSLLLSSTCRVLFFIPRVSDQPCSTSCCSSMISRSCAAGFNSRQCFGAIYASSGLRVVAESAVVVASKLGKDAKNNVAHSRTFFDVSSEQELLFGLKKEVEGGKLPSNFASLMEELYQNYQNAVFQSGISGADEIVVSNMASLFDRVLLDLEDPFVFPSHHKAIREPFDYFMFGQNYIRPLIDFENSYVGNLSIFHEMEEKLQQGHNIILISNHQSEADPAIIALLLEKTNPSIAENMTYVAGDRVLTDVLCKPFSMGRNLVCVYSKNHMFDDPELVEMKKKANIRSLKEMTRLLRGGSQLVWIAPSGGRDRPDPLTNEWYPARFDSWSVDNIRRLAEHAGVPVHFYPLALLCYNIMPPPRKIEREIGERRVIGFHGCGLSVSPSICFSEIISGFENSDQVREEYMKVVYKCVMEQYKVLTAAIHARQGLHASTTNVCLSKPPQFQ